MKKIFQKPFKVSLTKNILLILAILVVGYFIINLSLKLITRHGQEFEVPDFYGMTLDEAAKAAESLDLRLAAHRIPPRDGLLSGRPRKGGRARAERKACPASLNSPPCRPQDDAEEVHRKERF